MLSTRLLTFIMLASFIAAVKITTESRAQLASRSLSETGGPYRYHARDGDILTIIHRNTRMSLHSHNIRYLQGSKQQEVTCYWHRDSNDYWILRHANRRYVGTGFMNGDIILLFHKNTGKALHSHNIKSSVTGQQEVSAFWRRDANDYWRLDTMGKRYLRKGFNFRLFHKNTNKSLHSHHPRLRNGSKQQEVTGYNRRDSNDYWYISRMQWR
jgi:dolichyl-phosphate-mannose--protein O-mannosyl transferase